MVRTGQPIGSHRTDVLFRECGRHTDLLGRDQSVPWFVMIGWRVLLPKCCPHSKHGLYLLPIADDSARLKCTSQPGVGAPCSSIRKGGCGPLPTLWPALPARLVIDTARMAPWGMCMRPAECLTLPFLSPPTKLNILQVSPPGSPLVSWLFLREFKEG